MIDAVRGSKLTPEQAAELERAQERMIERHKLIKAMIRNNELQLKNESARGGAEIERECALRDAEKPGAGDAARAEVENMTKRLRALEDEHERLVYEREWLNASLLEYESGPRPPSTEKRDTHDVGQSRQSRCAR